MGLGFWRARPETKCGDETIDQPVSASYRGTTTSLMAYSDRIGPLVELRVQIPLWVETTTQPNG